MTAVTSLGIDFSRLEQIELSYPNNKHTIYGFDFSTEPSFRRVHRFAQSPESTLQEKIIEANLLGEDTVILNIDVARAVHEMIVSMTYKFPAPPLKSKIPIPIVKTITKPTTLPDWLKEQISKSYSSK